MWMNVKAKIKTFDDNVMNSDEPKRAVHSTFQVGNSKSVTLCFMKVLRGSTISFRWSDRSFDEAFS